MKLKYFWGICAMAVVGCSGPEIAVRHRPWQRVDKKNLTTSSGMPNFYMGDFPKAISITDKKVKWENPLEKSPARKIYFIGLYRQQKELERLLEVEPAGEQCPAFHHEVVTWGKEVERGLASSPEHLSYNYQNLVLSTGNVSAFPELSLPVESKGRSVLDLVEENPTQANAYLKQGLKDHYNRTKQEIAELCDRGTSDSFYIYENFIRHIQAHPEYWKNKENLASAFKVPVVGNYYLIHSMSHFPVNQYEKEILRRVGLEWLPSHLGELKKKRETVGNSAIGRTNASSLE